MATVDKNFRIKSGLIVQGTTGTIDGEDILTTSAASTQHIIGIVGGETLVTSVDANQLAVTGGELSILTNTFDAYGSASDAQTAAQTFATNADTTLYGTVATDIATAKSEAGVIAQGYADTAESDAIAAAALDATSKAAAAQVTAEATASADATSKANAAQSAAETFATNADATLYGTVTSDISTAKSEAIDAANGYTNTAVANLIDTAPAMLNTLNELAASLGNNADFIGTVNSAIGEKVAKAGDTMTGELVLFGAPTQGNAAATKAYVDTASSGAYSDAIATASDDATAKANAAEQNANVHTDNAIASGNSDASPVYREIDITWATKNVGSYASIANVETAAIYAWSTNYASAKFIVRTRSGNHSQVSEILVTADINKNLAITEYGIVGTNGNIADIAVDYDSVNNQYRLLATTTATGTEAIVSGTLMAYGD